MMVDLLFIHLFIYLLIYLFMGQTVISLFVYSGVLFVGLLIRRRDHVARHFMGHDLKQFKSLEVAILLFIFRGSHLIFIFRGSHFIIFL